MSILSIIVGFSLGLLANYFHLAPKRASTAINAFIINVALPCVILLKVPALSVDTNTLAPALLAWLVIVLSATCIYSAGRYFSWPHMITGALLLTVPLSNTAYLGLPVIDAVFNDEVLRYAIVYDQLGNFFGLAIYGPLVIALLSSADSQANVFHVVGNIIKRIIFFVPFPVILVALFLLDSNSIPDVLLKPLHFVAALMGPLAGFIVGLAVRVRIPSESHTPLMVGLIVKLIVAPLSVVVLARLITPNAAVLYASIAQAAMPTMITAGLMGIAAGYNERLIIAMISFSTALSLLTLPAWWLLI